MTTLLAILHWGGIAGGWLFMAWFTANIVTALRYERADAKRRAERRLA